MKHKGKIITSAALILALGIAALFFYFRSPVLVVGDEPFAILYGGRRAKIQQLRASLALGRRVKQVMLADNVGTDLVVLAVEEAEARPWCVVFPYRYADGARRFYEQHPEIQTVLLYSRAVQRGRRAAPAADSDDSGLFFEFFTDKELDFYRTGCFAAIIGGEETGIIPIFVNKDNAAGMRAGKDAFLQGFGDDSPELEPKFYDSYSDFTLSGEFPLVVLAGSGTEFFDKNPQSPIILFSWLDPSFTGSNTQVIMDDSVWAQLVPALNMVKKGEKSGQIPSKPLIFSRRVADKDILRQLKKAAASDMLSNTEEP